MHYSYSQILLQGELVAATAITLPGSSNIRMWLTGKQKKRGAFASSPQLLPFNLTAC